MKIERAQQWTAILNATHKMLKHAHAQEWDELVSLELLRRTQIEKFFSSAATEDEVKSITNGTQQILSLDKEIMLISKKQRDALGSKLSELNQSQRAKKAFLQNTG